MPCCALPGLLLLALEAPDLAELVVATSRLVEGLGVSAFTGCFGVAALPAIDAPAVAGCLAGCALGVAVGRVVLEACGVAGVACAAGLDTDAGAGLDMGAGLDAELGLRGPLPEEVSLGDAGDVCDTAAAGEGAGAGAGADAGAGLG